MIDPPKRTGYRLTYDAECLYNDWQEIGGCSCHTGCAPCSSCCSDGNPISLEENDEAWEIDEEVEDMARDNITDKSDPPKSEWFNGKYRVTPETSKLLQEAVFADGGGWGYDCEGKVAHTYKPFLIVRGKEITFSDDGHYFENCVHLPEKQPPQVKKEGELFEFKISKWYKCIEGFDFDNILLEGKYYQVKDKSRIKTLQLVGGESCYWKESRFDINSESDYDPNAKKVVDTEVKESKLGTSETYCDSTGKWVVPKEFAGCVLSSNIVNSKQNDFSITKEDINIMSNQNRVVSVKFFDDDAGLKAENSLVASYEITTRANDAMTVNKLLMREDIAGDIDLHNKVRASTVDATILKNTGNKVMLQPVDFEDLRVEVRQV